MQDHSDPLASIADPPPDGAWSLSDRGGPFIQLVGPVYVTRTGLETGEPVRFGFRVCAKHCNVRRVRHGGMLATFLDVVLACTLRELPDVTGPLPTISMTLDYLDPAPCGTWIESRVTVSKLGGSIAFAQALLVGPLGPVLRGSGVYKRSQRVE